MKTIQVRTTKQNIEDIADIIDMGDSPVRVNELYFPYGYFKEFPELQLYLDNETFNNLKFGNIEAVKFIGVN